MVNINAEFKTTRQKIIQFYESLEKMIPTDFKNHLPDLNDFPLGEGDLKEYRLWCLEKKLYINPLNDLGPYPIASHKLILMR